MTPCSTDCCSKDVSLSEACENNHSWRNRSAAWMAFVKFLRKEYLHLYILVHIWSIYEYLWHSSQEELSIFSETLSCSSLEVNLYKWPLSAHAQTVTPNWLIVYHTLTPASTEGYRPWTGHKMVTTQYLVPVHFSKWFPVAIAWVSLNKCLVRVGQTPSNFHQTITFFSAGNEREKLL